MAWTKMSTVPNPLMDSNGDVASGYVLKCYLPGTTTATSIATDSSGGTTVASMTTNAAGVWEVSGNEVIPHIDRKVKFGIFANATDAAANTPFYMGPFDNIEQSEPSTGLVITNNIVIFETVADMVASTALSVGLHARTLGYNTIGDGGGNDYQIVASGTGADDGGAYIDLATHQAKGLFTDERYTPKMWGAKGDGVTNDNASFKALAAYVQAVGGGHIVISPGTYILGKQTFAGQTGLSYSYKADTMLEFDNLTKPLMIEGKGAIMKLDSGLKYGSFDPVTGLAYVPVMPFLDNDYKADLGFMIRVYNSPQVVIRDIELDGNDTGMTIGGEWGDVGTQIGSYGIQIRGVDNCVCENINTHHHCLDGISVGYYGLTETSPLYPTKLSNVVSEYNGRLGFSWVGGKQLMVENCRFSYTGKSVMQTSPGAGVDIEAESSICRNGIFVNCEMSHNTGAAMVADSGDSADIEFQLCKFIGSTNISLWPQKPRMVFRDCLIVGEILSFYSDYPNNAEAPKFYNCTISDEAKYSASVSVTGAALINANSAYGALFQDCSIISERSRPVYATGEVVFRDCKIVFKAGTENINNKDYAMLFWSGTIVDNTKIISDIQGTEPTDAFYISTTGAIIKPTSEIIEVTSNKLYWDSWSVGASGYAGQYGEPEVNEVSQQALLLHSSMRKNQWDGFRRIFYGTGAPTWGTYREGDIVFNQSPSPGGVVGWICTTAGTQGTWKSFGTIAV